MKKFSLAALSVIAILTVGGSALGALTTNQKLLIQNAIKDSDTGKWVSALLNVVIAQPSGFLTSNIDAKSANVRKVHFKLQDNNAIGRSYGVTASQEANVTTLNCYESDSATGAAFVTTAGSSAWAGVAGSGAVLSLVSGKSGLVVSPATGWTTVSLTQTSSTVPTHYFCCIMPDKQVACTAGFTP